MKRLLALAVVGCIAHSECPSGSDMFLGDLLESDCTNTTRLRPEDCTTLSEAVENGECEYSWLSYCPGGGYAALDYDTRAGRGQMTIRYPECTEIYEVSR